MASAASSSAAAPPPPPPPATNGGSTPVAAPTAARVVAAEEAAAAAEQRRAALEADVAGRNAELAAAKAKVEEAESSRVVNKAQALEEALGKLHEEEAALMQALDKHPNKQLLSNHLGQLRALEEEEQGLQQALNENERIISSTRAKLAHPPRDLLPMDAAQAALYVTWKKALAEREELLRQARQRKHELLQDLKARHESQVVLLEMERRAAVDNIKDSLVAEKELEAKARHELAQVEEGVKQATAAMIKFRKEFEQLRVALLIDRMAKGTEIAGLNATKDQLTKEAEAFQAAVDAAKEEAAAEVRAAWQERLAEARQEGEKRFEAEVEAIEVKMNKVRDALTDKYEAGFQPLLAEAEARHLEELNRVVELQRTLEAKEAELAAAHDEARRAAALEQATATSSIPPEERLSADEEAEFNLLRETVTSLWDELDMAPEDIIAFLSECDMIAPATDASMVLYSKQAASLGLKAGTTAARSPSHRADGAGGGAGAAPHSTKSSNGHSQGNSTSSRRRH